VNRDGYGAIAGRVLDDEGNPVPRVHLACGFQDAWTAADGGFRLEGIPAGAALLWARKFGWNSAKREVVVAPGEEARVEIALPPRDAGSLEVAGRVVDDDGRPVPGAEVWCGGTHDLSRDARTDARGEFRLRRIPASFSGKTLFVSVLSDDDAAGFLSTTVEGVPVPAPGLVIEVERTTMLHLVVRDGPDGPPLPLFNVEMSRERTVDGETTLVPFRSATLHEEDGTWRVPVPRGRIVLFVEAPDRVPIHAAIEVPSLDGPFEAVFPMAR
jgi:hypothetical protein